MEPTQAHCLRRGKDLWLPCSVMQIHPFERRVGARLCVTKYRLHSTRQEPRRPCTSPVHVVQAQLVILPLPHGGIDCSFDDPSGPLRVECTGVRHRAFMIDRRAEDDAGRPIGPIVQLGILSSDALEEHHAMPIGSRVDLEELSDRFATKLQQAWPSKAFSVMADQG